MWLISTVICPYPKQAFRTPDLQDVSMPKNEVTEDRLREVSQPSGEAAPLYLQLTYMYAPAWGTAAGAAAVRLCPVDEQQFRGAVFTSISITILRESP